MTENVPLEEQNAPEIGLIIKRFFKEKRIYRSALSRKLKVRLNTVLDYEKRQTMQTGTLWNLSVALKHNFFSDIAHQLPTDFSTYAPVNTTLPERIAVLENENELLKAQLEGLERVMTK